MTVSYRDLGLNVDDAPMRETARDWFATLPEAQQQTFFSKVAWDAYKAGDVTLDDFIGVSHSDDWGNAFIEKSLKAILGN